MIRPSIVYLFAMTVPIATGAAQPAAEPSLPADSEIRKAARRMIERLAKRHCFA